MMLGQGFSWFLQHDVMETFGLLFGASYKLTAFTFFFLVEFLHFFHFEIPLPRKHENVDGSLGPVFLSFLGFSRFKKKWSNRPLKY